jgi:hypothetical protein
MAARSPVTSDSNVIIDYLTPGACKSDIFRDDASCKIAYIRNPRSGRGWLMYIGIQRLIMNIMISMIARTTEQGSRTIVHAASPDIGTDAHGAFLMDCKVFPWVDAHPGCHDTILIAG